MRMRKHLYLEPYSCCFLVRAAQFHKRTTQATSLNQLINSLELNELIDEALSPNPSLQQTMLSLKIIQAQYRQATIDRLPEASYDMSGEKTEADDESYSG